MVIYHFSVKTISRSQGRSATASIAYRAGEKIVDEQTDEVHDYTRKQGVKATQIVLPPNAPEWAKDREKLWNAAEQAETRKNSTVAREIIVALPAELDDAARYRMVKKFSERLVDKHQCAVDFAIHEPSRDGDYRNHHAHLLLTTRQLSENGFEKKTREWDDRKTGTVDYWRAEWAKHVNRYMAQNRQEGRVTHLSYRDRGIDDREPMQHKGVALTAMERRERKAIMQNPNTNIIQKSRAFRNSEQQKQKTVLPEQPSGYNFGHIADTVENLVWSEDMNLRIAEREFKEMKEEQQMLYRKHAALERMGTMFPHMTDNQIYGVVIMAGEVDEILHIKKLDKNKWEVENSHYFSKDYKQQNQFIASVNYLMDVASTEQGLVKLEHLGRELKLDPELPQSVDEYLSKSLDWHIKNQDEQGNYPNYAKEVIRRTEIILEKQQEQVKQKRAEQKATEQAKTQQEEKNSTTTEQPKPKQGRGIRH